jgi:hypothetical protein
VLLAGFVSACTKIPEPESAGGQLYAQRCSQGCHGAYRVDTMKFEMWKMVVRRMQGEMVRRGLPALTDTELQTLLEYLERHSVGG